MRMIRPVPGLNDCQIFMTTMLGLDVIGSAASVLQLAAIDYSISKTLYEVGDTLFNTASDIKDLARGLEISLQGEGDHEAVGEAEGFELSLLGTLHLLSALKADHMMDVMGVSNPSLLEGPKDERL